MNNTRTGINSRTLTLGENPMTSRIQQLAKKANMSYDEFIGEMRKRGCSEPTAEKLWNGTYETFDAFNDNDIYLSNLRKAADVFKVKTGTLLDD
jgi:Ca2+-binding EF-hand superfamily protein